MEKNNLEQLLSEKILILDGAMGTMIQKYSLKEDDYRGTLFKKHLKDLKGLNDLLSLTKPEVIEEIHRSFLDAGADIIETNTFNATSVSLKDYELVDSNLVYQLNLESGRIAKRLADEYSIKDESKPRFVAGSIGPTSKCSSISSNAYDPSLKDVSFDELVVSYKEQISGLIDGGVDILLVETVFDTLNCKAALFAVNVCFEEKHKVLPVMISGTVTEGGRFNSGQTLEAFLNSISFASPFCIGLNCSLGSDKLYPYLKELSAIAPSFVSCYPNAGLPNEMGEYDHSPEHMASIIKKFASEELVNIVGGCCGSTPEHIKMISEVVSGIKPRIKPENKVLTRLSGLEPLNITDNIKFINIGERANITGSRKFANLIKDKKYEEALEVARDQIINGASVIDINMDDSMLDSRKEMVHFLNLISSDPDIAKVPLMIDSSKWEILLSGMKCVPGKGVVNSISLKEGEENFRYQADIIKKMGFAAIIMAFDEKGQADTVERRVEICTRSYKILVDEVGFLPEDIIFDLNVFAIATGMVEHDNYALDFIEACKIIRKTLPYVHVSGGLSNLSFSFRGNNTLRASMHSVFLYHAIQAGMDFGIVNPGQVPVYDELDSVLRELVEDVVLNRKSDATEKLIEFAENIKSDITQKNKIEKWRGEDVRDRIKHAIIRGITKYIEEDLEEVLPLFDAPVEIIEGPLMSGMAKVGELFGEGKMFLPQVIKTARVMRKAVAYLTPFIEKDNVRGGSKGKILLATVKGDVHDIGKNIVEVVLRCNNFDVINIGEMVLCEDILKAAKDHNVDIIGLSGLITPSLDEMVLVAKEMRQQGFSIPLLIGGATTSKIHTAVKIAPEYPDNTVYVKDASQSVTIVSKLLNKKDRDSLLSELSREYKQVRESYFKKTQSFEYLSIKEARNNKLSIDWKQNDICTPFYQGVKEFIEFPLKEIIPFIDWKFFFNAWESSHASEEEKSKLKQDALDILDLFVSKGDVKANGVIGIFPANSQDDDIIIYENDDRNNILLKLNTLRQQRKTSLKNIALADFIASVESGVKDYIGMFMVTAGLGVDSLVKKFESDGDDYNAIMVKIMSDRLAEAFAEKLHLILRTELWGYETNDNYQVDELFKCHYQGIRPAPGYPPCPDHSDKISIFKLLDVERRCNVTLTDSFMMVPESSVCGFYFANSYSKYFSVGKIKDDQLEDYSSRKGVSLEAVYSLLSQNRIS